jgi:hypothetical protein
MVESTLLPPLDMREEACEEAVLLLFLTTSHFG